MLIALEEEEVCVPSLGRCDWCTIVCVALTIDPYINSSLSCAHSNKIAKGTGYDNNHSLSPQDGLTAMSQARTKGHLQIVELLQQYNV